MAWRSLLVELLCGALYVLLYQQWSISVPSVVFALLAVVLLVVACIDLAHTIIPDAITLPGMLAGLLASVVLTPVGLGNALIGALLGGGVFLVIAVLSRGGMGGGDIKLIAMIGAFLGWQAVLATMFLGALLLTLLGLALMLLRQKRRQDPLPFGPFLATGALLTMVWGDVLLTWYQQFTL